MFPAAVIFCEQMERRTLLRLLGASTVAATAGCSTQGDGDGGEPSATTRTSDSTTDEMTTATTTETESGTETESTSDAGLVTVTSDQSFQQTVDRIERDIEGGNLTLMTTVDHAANAEQAGMDLPPTTLFVFGNPNVGTPLMQASRTMAIDLPQKLLVWEDGEETKVTYNDPTSLADRHGIEGNEETLQKVAGVLERLATGGEA
jgi:uncharacterized protein (DUF302 family)